MAGEVVRVCANLARMTGVSRASRRRVAHGQHWWFGLVALMLASSYLLDGPSDMEAIQATADAKNDAIKSAAISPINTGARGQNDQQTIVAAVQP